MGNTFKLIADSALYSVEAEYPHCQVCNTTGSPIYPTEGNLISEDGTADEGIGIAAACESCLKGCRIAQLSEFHRLYKVIQILSKDPLNELKVISQTPNLPSYLQEPDWPLCCGQLTEFIGNEFSGQASFWEFGIIQKLVELPPKDIIDTDLVTPSFFTCYICDTSFWICQAT